MYFTTSLCLSDPIVQNILCGSCPHCKQCGFLRSHGYLRGYKECSGNQQVIRARRIFCSNRHNLGGCGKTFPIYLQGFIPSIAITTASLLLFFHNLLQDKSIAKSSPFSDHSAKYPYRLLKKIRLKIPEIRTLLNRIRPPPRILESNNPLIQSLLHLFEAFPVNPINSYHLTFQTPLF